MSSLVLGDCRGSLFPLVFISHFGLHKCVPQSIWEALSTLYVSHHLSLRISLHLTHPCPLPTLSQTNPPTMSCFLPGTRLKGKFTGKQGAVES